ncbi:glycosyl hydrolase [Croceivirga lutea]|uniref:glycoside hydrolase family 3 protein n=1 Tax=Croceivirga lutea TaxID=1775167 RepID=UPI001639653E|nr:glycoside hydrolase family 3 protein [Croceivirga lutea]GGG48669.1 glycosyl hydrolase [Croceivirga lutea]
MYRFSVLAICLSVILSCKEKSTKKAEEVEAIPTQVSLREKIGQMVMVGFRGLDAPKGSSIYTMVDTYKIGGVVLFNRDLPSKETLPRNISSPEQVKQLNIQLQEIDTVPLFIAIDEEGGLVSRLKAADGFQNHKSHQEIGQLNNLDSTRVWASTMAQELADLGFNVNFGPVVDLNVNTENPIIGGKKRSFSNKVETVINHAQIFIQEHAKRNILTVPKHFPGHGSSKNDTHLGLADVTDTWSNEELIPFKETINKTGFIMTSHVYNANLDTLPATISPKIIQGVLREDFGFEGVIASDDMHMKAISNFYDFETSIEKAIIAGVDMLVFGGNVYPCPENDADCIEVPFNPNMAKDAVEYIEQLVNEGKLTEQRIEESYNRIMRLKEKL